MDNNSLSKITILDGGFGRELQKRGVCIDAPLWSANAFYTNSELIEEVHRAFIDSGADIISTNTYALTSYNLEKADKQNDQESLIDQAYHMAKKAANGTVKIAASVPPLVESYRPDLVDENRMQSEYAFLVDKAIQHQVDIILAETMSCKIEALAVLKHKSKTDIPFWIGFTVNEEGNLRSGELLEEAAKEVIEKGASCVLINCSTLEGTNKSIDILCNLSEYFPLTYGAYANRFFEVRPDFTLESGINTLNDEITKEDYKAYAKHWLDKGTTIIGGCCGIGVNYIAELSTLRDS